MLDDLAVLVFAGFATASAVWAWLRDGNSRRRTWLALACGLGAWTVGTVVSTYYESLPPHTALLLFAVGAGAALLCFPVSPDPTPRAQLLLDATIVAGSLFVVSWVSVLGSVYRTDADTRLAYTLAVASPVADVLIATTAIMVWVRAGNAPLRTLGLLSAGIMLMALADSAIAFASARGEQQLDGWIDLGCIVAFGVLGIAALSSGGEPASASPRTVPVHARLWLPYVPLLLAAGIGVGAMWHSVHSGPLRAVAVILLVAVLVRQFVVLAENRRLTVTVSRQTLRDRLTGLASRTLFLDRLEQAVQRQRMELTPLTVLRLDLDDFEAVTSRLGHAAGEEVLIRVAERLTGCLTSTDSLARFQGGEFAALIEGPVEDALVAADRVLESFTRTFVFDGAALSIRPSIGVTVASAAAVDTTTEGLLSQADVALIAAKNAGGGCLRSHVPGSPPPLAARMAMPATTAATGQDPLPSAASESLRSVRAHWLSSTVPSARSVPIMLGLLLIGVLIYGGSTQIRDHAGRLALFDSWLFDGLMLGAAALVAARAWLVSSERAAWSLVSAGMASSALGDVVLAVFVPEGQSPSIADPFYLAFYPVVYAGLALLLRSRLRRLPMAIWLDSVTAGLTLAAVAAAIAYGPIHAATIGTPLTVVVGLAYSMGDLLLLALAVGALAVLGWRAEQRWGLLVAGFISYAAADTAYLFATAGGRYTEGSTIDTLWPVASLLVAVAAWRATTRRPARSRSELAIWAPPMLCTATAVTLLVLDHDSPLPRLAVVLAALTLIAVTARFAVTFREVTALADSHRQAMTDDLTTLANRRAMATALTAAAFEYSAKDAGDERSGPGLLLIDLDRFKDINDALGHHVADQLLCQVADRLSQSVRPSHLLARLGGDEFAVLLPAGADLPAARTQADRLIAALQRPFELDEMAVQVEASIGIALCPQHCPHPEDLLQRADAAMYLAKRSPTRIAVYDSADDPTDDRQTIEELRTAIAEGELTCHYQPKVSAADGQVHGVEALVRWNHPVRGLLVPDQFLALAEQGGLMRPLATTVLDLALSQARSWHDQGNDLSVAVNLSVTNLLDVDLVTDINRLLRIHRMPASTLILEITESVLSTDSLRSHSVVEGLRRLGIGLSIDDYGTGWSSLARLQDMDVDELKLDQVFVAHLSEDPRSIAIVRSTVALAHSLGASLVAEGVEDEATLEALRRYGCDITQGYFHSPPLPAEELDAWLPRQSARA
ncbi:diguanylate cyclase domain-containing protein [Antrihabitans stalactiti]|uniref:Diguanylate cyclase n=1 Tax=Antrihabitans stalactiti TaxID=2584121 RepID=A0A848K4Z2_9NOCA|nr:diguanylate cyclase [Antrihabitans stalactiti]NMN93783.1 diguanylate cyclase [Antrihabitans stalactiti]